MKAINGFNGYFVTKQGEVFSTKGGKIRMLKPGKTPNHYLQVSLSKDGKVTNHYVHRLVAQAYLDNPNNLICTCHKNDMRWDNRVENLFWGSYQDNATDKVNKQRQARGTNVSAAKLTEGQVRYIKSVEIKRGVKAALAREHNVSVNVICNILSGKNWTHIK